MPLTASDGSVAQQTTGLGECRLVVRRRTGRSRLSRSRGPQCRAADGLGVEAAVERGRRTRRAQSAHIGKPSHRRGGPVVGEPGDDGEPRAAVGARHERVPVAAVAGGRDRSSRQSSQMVTSGATKVCPGALLGLADRGSRCRHSARGGCSSTPTTWRQRRGIALQAQAEGLDLGRRPLDLGDDTVTGVPDAARQVERSGQGIDEGAKSDTLHRPVHHDSAPHARSRGQSAHTHRIPWRDGCRVGPASGRLGSAGPTRQSMV